VTNRVLLTVSGTIAPDLGEQIAAGQRPRADFLELAAVMQADLLDHPTARAETDRVGRLLGRIGGASAVLAWECHRRRRRYDVVVTDGEQVGLPLAVLSRLGRHRSTHVMIAHIMSVPKKALLFRALRLRRRIDRYLTYATAQSRYLIHALGVEPERISRIPFMVDTRFFAPDAVPAAAGERPMICSAGLEFRDYPTLIEAVTGLDVDVVLAAASPWSKRNDSTAGVALPPNVRVGRLSLHDLRQLYADTTIVVVPLVETDFQAGITTILEAMAMGKPLICTRTTGQTDTVVDDVNGRYVPAADPAALAEQITRLLADGAARQRLGAAARCDAVEHAELDVYAAQIARIVASARDERG
jgi:glycosyltransferase involved in cell wall biosynthesis